VSLRVGPVLALALLPGPGAAQPWTTAERAILVAEDRRAPTAEDLAVITSGLACASPRTRRIAVRAQGRLERAALVQAIQPLVTDPSPAVRVEAANAIGQALAREASASDAIVGLMLARLVHERDEAVQEALLDAIGRLPFASNDAARSAEEAMVRAVGNAAPVWQRRGLGTGLETLYRRRRMTASPVAARRLHEFLGVSPSADTTRDTVLQALARDAHDNVHEAAVAGLSRVAGRDADAVYLAALESIVEGTTIERIVVVAARK
jgi:HEAT repeats